MKTATNRVAVFAALILCAWTYPNEGVGCHPFWDQHQEYVVVPSDQFSGDPGTISYLGTTPNHMVANWLEHYQGAAHNFSRGEFVYSVQDAFVAIPHQLGLPSTRPGGTIEIPLSNVLDLDFFDHMGDPDIEFVDGIEYLFIPVESVDKFLPARLLVYRASNYSHVLTAMMSLNLNGHQAPWVAAMPGNGLVFSSDYNSSFDDVVLHVYEFSATGPGLYPVDEFPLYCPDGLSPVQMRQIQGGDFSPSRGHLVLFGRSTSASACAGFSSGWGLHFFDMIYGTLTAFMPVTVTGDEEPEGLDITDYSSLSPSVPMSGRVHAVVVDHDANWPSSDTMFWYKHWNVQFPDHF